MESNYQRASGCHATKSERDIQVFLFEPASCALTNRLAIFEFLPYGKRHGTAYRDEENYYYLARYGFACVRVDCRGTGESEGLIEDEYLPQELKDSVECIEWIAKQPWCTGSVGMTGISWGGFNSLQVASMKPPQLKGIMALCCSDDRYNIDVHYSGGCLSADNIAWGGFVLSLIGLPPDPAIAGDTWRDQWMTRLRNVKPWLNTWMEHQTYDEYWKHGSVKEDYDSISCPTLLVSGWADGYCRSVPIMLSKMQTNKDRVVLGLNGPWAHALPHAAQPGPSVDWLSECVRWWTYCLKGDKQMEEDWRRKPVYSAYIQERDEPNIIVTHRSGRWVSEQELPSKNIEPQTFLLSHKKTLESSIDKINKRVFKKICSPLSVGLDCGRLGYGQDPDFPVDQRHEDAMSLCFDSEVLNERVEALGSPTVHLVLTSDVEVASIAVRICDVDPKTDSSVLVAYGIMNLNQHKSQEKPEPLKPGHVYRVAIHCSEIGHAFPKGNKIRVGVSTSLWPLFWPSPLMPSINIFTKEHSYSKEVAECSRLELPVRKSPATIEDMEKEQPEIAGLYREPKKAPAHPRTEIRASKMGTRHLISDYVTGRKELVLAKDYGRYRDESNGIERDEFTKEVFRIQDPKHRTSTRDPVSSEMEVAYSIELRRSKDWIEKNPKFKSSSEFHTLVQSKTIVTCDENNFIVMSEVDAFEWTDGERKLVYTKKWEQPIRRNFI